MKYVVNTGFYEFGCDDCVIFEAENEAEAEKIGWDIALKNAKQYTNVVDPTYSKEALAELGNYVFEEYIWYVVEECIDEFLT